MLFSVPFSENSLIREISRNSGAGDSSEPRESSIDNVCCTTSPTEDFYGKSGSGDVPLPTLDLAVNLEIGGESIDVRMEVGREKEETMEEGMTKILEKTADSMDNLLSSSVEELDTSVKFDNMVILEKAINSSIGFPLERPTRSFKNVEEIITVMLDTVVKSGGDHNTQEGNKIPYCLDIEDDTAGFVKHLPCTSSPIEVKEEGNQVGDLESSKATIISCVVNVIETMVDILFLMKSSEGAKDLIGKPNLEELVLDLVRTSVDSMVELVSNLPNMITNEDESMAGDVPRQGELKSQAWESKKEIPVKPSSFQEAVTNKATKESSCCCTGCSTPKCEGCNKSKDVKLFKGHASLRQCCKPSSKCVRAVKRKRNSSTDSICGNRHEDMLKTTSTKEMQKQSPIITEHDVIKVGGFNFISFDTI